MKWKSIFLLVLVQVYSLGKFLHQGSHILTGPLSTGTSLWCCHLVRFGYISFNENIQIFIIKIKTRNHSKCSMADSIYTYINQTTLLNKKTFTLSLATCHYYCLSQKMLLPDDTCMWFTQITPSIVSTPKLNLCKIIVGQRWISPFDLKLVVDGIHINTLKSLPVSSSQNFVCDPKWRIKCQVHFHW